MIVLLQLILVLLCLQDPLIGKYQNLDFVDFLFSNQRVKNVRLCRNKSASFLLKTMNLQWLDFTPFPSDCEVFPSSTINFCPVLSFNLGNEEGSDFPCSGFYNRNKEKCYHPDIPPHSYLCMCYHCLWEYDVLVDDLKHCLSHSANSSPYLCLTDVTHETHFSGFNRISATCLIKLIMNSFQ